jgi:hypothetical protein
LPPAYTGVLYLHHHKKEEEAAAAAALGQLNEAKKKREKWLKEMSGLLMVLAASVTYHAGLNPPGGFWQHNDGESHVAGTPVLQSNFHKGNNDELIFASDHGETPPLIFLFNV